MISELLFDKRKAHEVVEFLAPSLRVSFVGDVYDMISHYSTIK